MHTTDFLPDGARLWLPTYLAWFVGGMVLAVLQALGARAYAAVCIPLAVVCYLIASTPIAGAPTTSPAELREALVQGRLLRRDRDAGGGAAGTGATAVGTARLMASRPMVFLGEISYEIFLIHLVTMELVMVEVLHQPVYTGSVPACSWRRWW